MSKKGGGQPSNPSADQLAKISQQLFSQTDPIRQALVDRSAAFLGIQEPTPPPPGIPEFLTRSKRVRDETLSGRKTYTTERTKIRNPAYDAALAASQRAVSQRAPQLDVTQSPMYGALKHAADAQYRLAKNNLIATAPPGGALTSGLANLGASRASAMTTAIGGLAQDELSRAYGLATGGAQTGASGLSSAAGIQAQIAAANAQRQGMAKQGLGAGLGALGGGALFGPAGAKAGGTAGSQAGSK